MQNIDNPATQQPSFIVSQPIHGMRVVTTNLTTNSTNSIPNSNPVQFLKQGDIVYKNSMAKISTAQTTSTATAVTAGSTITINRPLTLTPVMSSNNSIMTATTVNKGCHVPRGPAVVANLTSGPRTAVATPIRPGVMGTTQLVRTVIPNRSTTSASPLILQNSLQWQKIHTTVINASSIPRPITVTASTASAQVHPRTQLITKNPMITTQNRVQQQLHGNQIQQNTAQIKPIPTISLSQMNAGAATSRTPTLVYTTSNATNYTATRVVSTNSLVNPVPVNISKSLVQTMTPKPLTLTGLGSTKITIAPVSQSKIPVNTTLTVTGTQNARVAFSNSQSNLFTRMANTAATTSMKSATTSSMATTIIGNPSARLTANILQLQNVIVSNSQGSRPIQNSAKVTFPVSNASIQISQINKGAPNNSSMIPIAVNVASGAQKTLQIDKTIGSTTITPLFYDQSNKSSNSTILNQVFHSKAISNSKPITVLNTTNSANIRLSQSVSSYSPMSTHISSNSIDSNRLPKITMPTNTGVVITTLAPATTSLTKSTITAATPTPSVVTTTIATQTTPNNRLNNDELAMTLHKLSNSPRPTILRKRDNEGTLLKAAKNLTSLIQGSQNNSQLPLCNLFDNNSVSNSFSENSNSNSNLSQSYVEYFDDNCRIIDEDRNYSDASPRKKPRKQQLAPGEMTEVKVKSEELQLALNKNKAKLMSKNDDYGNEITMKKRTQGSLLNCYQQTWKSTNNHFIKPTDVRPKNDRKISIIDIANQSQINKKINGWRIFYIAAEILEIKDIEREVYERLSTSLILDNCKERRNDKKICRIIELIKGNYQRCKLIDDSLETSKESLHSMFDHKVNISDIISRCDGKRNFKKRNML